MGAWGAGNFENDAALDAVEHVLEAAISEVAAFSESERCGVEDLEAVMAYVAIHLTLHEHCSASAPDASLAEALHTKVLNLYDERIDSLQPEAGYRVARRGILLDTLQKYRQAAGTGA